MDTSVKEAYRVLQQASGIEVGDTVQSIRHFKRDEGGFDGESSAWGDSKPRFVNEQFLGTVCSVKNGSILVDYDGLNGSGFFPFFALEVVKKAVQLPEDIKISSQYRAVFNKDRSIDVGCQHIEFSVLESIYEAAKGVK